MFAHGPCCRRLWGPAREAGRGRPSAGYAAVPATFPDLVGKNTPFSPDEPYSAFIDAARTGKDPTRSSQLVLQGYLRSIPPFPAWEGSTLGRPTTMCEITRSLARWPIGEWELSELAGHNVRVDGCVNIG